MECYLLSEQTQDQKVQKVYADGRHVLPETGAEDQADRLDEEVAIVMEIAEVIDSDRKDKLPALKNVPKKKLLEETAKVDKILSKFKTHSNTRTNENCSMQELLFLKVDQD